LSRYLVDGITTITPELNTILKDSYNLKNKKVGYWSSGVSIEDFSIITSTVTDPAGNTSEFSANKTVIPVPIIVVAFSPVNIIIEDPLLRRYGKD